MMRRLRRWTATPDQCREVEERLKARRKRLKAAIIRAELAGKGTSGLKQSYFVNAILRHKEIEKSLSGVGGLFSYVIIVHGPGYRYQSSAPPSGFLIDLLVPAERAEDMLLQLHKGFDRWSLKYGVRRARGMFLVHSVGTVVGFWFDWIRARAETFLKLLAS